jgi:hypothetical protein
MEEYNNYQKYKIKNDSTQKNGINYNININYPINMRHIKYNNKDILLFGDFHGDTNNYCKNIDYTNLDDFIKKLIEDNIKVGLYLEFPYSKDSYSIIEEEFDVKDDKEPLAMVAKTFSKCYNSKCSDNFTLFPVDIRYYDEFLKVAVFSIMIKEKSAHHDKKILLKSIEWYIKFLNNFLKIEIIENLLKIVSINEKKILMDYLEREKKEYILLLAENAELMNIVENAQDFETLLEQLNKQIILINGFMMDIYIILLFMTSQYSTIIGYFGMAYTKRIFDFFINNMKNYTKIIKEYIPDGEYNDNTDPDKEKFTKYPERCLKNVDIKISTKHNN